jgi:Protein of unknown function (DUF2846)
MHWCVLVLIAATTALSGCVTTREGADFASASQSAGAPRAGQGRIVVFQEQAYGGLFDQGYPITLDGAPMGELKTGTFLYLDRSAGRHQLSVNQWDFPGVTRQDISVAPGRTYFFLVKPSERSKALQAGTTVAGLTGFFVTAAVTSGDHNPGPVDFVPLDDAAGRQAISGLRLAR